MSLLRFTCINANVTVGINTKVASKLNNIFQYKKNGEGEWTGFTSTSVELTPGDYIELKGNGFVNPNISWSIFSMSGTGKIEASGDVTSLLNEVGGNVTITKDYQFKNMFRDCTNLITTPSLPSTTLKVSCYDGMFYGCTSLTTAPELPAMTLANSCYNYMFSNCTNLTAAPTLPATALAENCYMGMFGGCTNLTAAPTLPVATLVKNCYNGMFSGCTNLTAAPALPATTLADYCYCSMFAGCTNLTVAPELPVTTLTDYCYNEMFYGCTSLTTAPALPATTLTKSCYEGMFYGCTSLTTAPELPADTLATWCYDNMFDGCSNLNYVKIGAETPSPLVADDWLADVASAGTLEITNNIMQVTENDSSSLPTGWTLVRTSPSPTPSLDSVTICGNVVDLTKGTVEVTLPEFGTFTIEIPEGVDVRFTSTNPDIKINESIQKGWSKSTITLTKK